MPMPVCLSFTARNALALVVAGVLVTPLLPSMARAADPAPVQQQQPTQVAPQAQASGPPHQIAKPGGGVIDCDATDADNELLACARKDLDAGQKRLDDLVKQTQASLPAAGRSTFDAAHKAWLAYRDADCRWNAYDVETGRTSELILMSCLADLTISRMEELDAGFGNQ